MAAVWQAKQPGHMGQEPRRKEEWEKSGMVVHEGWPGPRESVQGKTRAQVGCSPLRNYAKMRPLLTFGEKLSKRGNI